MLAEGMNDFMIHFFFNFCASDDIIGRESMSFIFGQ